MGEFGRVEFYIDLLAERGPLLDEPFTRQLRGCASCDSTSEREVTRCDSHTLSRAGGGSSC